jgi:peptidyl-dipeptidase Dcp
LQNPLLTEFQTPFKSAPFSKILPEHFVEAILKNINDSISLIELISIQKEIPTFDNTINGLQESSKQLGRNVSLLFNLNSAETSPKLQEVTQKIAPHLSKYKNDILLNKKLFKRVKFVYLKSDKSILSPEQNTLL